MKKVKKIVTLFCPPIILKSISSLKGRGKKINSKNNGSINSNPEQQDLNLYWDNEYAKVLEEWGKENTWNEIQLILGSCKGKVLDIACGTGITIELLSKFPQLELYGFDISDLLIEKAIQRNIPKERLKIADATKVNYDENEFDYSFSIGSLEHFTFEGIDKFISESSRITRKVSFHMIPVSKSKQNEGWMKTVQSFFNNSEDWWLEKFKKHYTRVYCISSKWEDSISDGKWFICVNEI
ncbi:MAG: class I SAM-dependent methyltransferase [Methylotenera sp.]|nr:class I SAM-dependent methyltransferase [Flavobacterium sp.]